MAYTNSPLATYTRISPNRNSPRNQPITKITIHHMAGVNTVEGFGNIVANPAREMSANYAIGNDGRIGLFCPESDRSWCSSSPWNDNRAITIEVSNSMVGGDWPVSDAAYNSLINLCVDICKRNGIPKLEFTGDQNGSLTFHYMYAQTCCPGPWIKARAQEICDKVNARLNAGGGAEPNKPDPFKPYTVRLKTTDPVYDKPGGKQISFVGRGTVFTIVEDSIVNNIKYGRLKSGKGWVVVEKLKTTTNVASAAPKAVSAPLTSVQDNMIRQGDYVKISPNAKYYTGAGIPLWVINDVWYVDQINGNRVVLGRNQSNTRNIQSPINVSYLSKVSGTTSSTNNDIVKGSIVRVLNPIIYGTNNRFYVYASQYYVLEVSGDRVVISSDGVNVTSAIAKSNLQKIK